MSRYIVIETLISMAINAAISAGFAWLVFGGRTVVELWGTAGLAADFAPQTFMIALMSTLVPTILTRRRLGAGALAPAAKASPLPRNLLLRALLIAATAMILLGGLAVLLLASAWRAPLAWSAVLPLKVAYGALVALLVTPVALRAALSDGGTRARP